MSLRAGDAVLFVTPHFRPHIGGVEQYVEQLAETLHERHGLRPIVATTSPRAGATAAARDSPIEVHDLPAPARVFNTPVGPGWTRALRRLVVRERIALVNAHAPVPVLADLAARATGGNPFVLTYHTGPIDRAMRTRAWVGDAYERFVLPATAGRADRVVCSSEHVAAAFRSAFAGKSVVIPPAVDMRAFSPGAGGPEPRRLLFVGSLERTTAYKALPDLLEAVRRLLPEFPGLTLDVAGDGDGRPAHERLAERLGIAAAVRFRGSLCHSEMTDAYRAAAIVCHPTHHDSFPTVLVEAMACGRPVVSTLVGGIPSLVSHEDDGLLYPAGDLDALTGSLRTLLADPGRGEAMGRRGRAAVAATLSREAQADRTLEVFSEAVARRSPRRPRRVAIVTPYFPPKAGGVERYAQKVAGAVAGSGDMEALVITSNHDGRGTVVEEVDGLPVVRLGAWFKVSNTPVNPLWPLTVRRLLTRHGIDLVNAHSPVPFFADAAIMAAPCPVVFTYHSGSMEKVGRSNRLIRGYERHALPRLFSRARTVVAVSRASLGHAVPGSLMISPGVDADAFTPGPLPPSAAAPSMLFVGRLERSSAWKGVDYLLRAFALVHREIPAARLVLVGDGDARAGLESLAERLGVRASVDFAGFLGGDDLVEAYRAASVLVLPSLTDAESFGMTLVEAMACGRPVIGSRIGGIPDVIDDEVTGLIVPPGDASALAQACLRILRDGALADRLGARGREDVVASHRWATGLERYLELFRELAPAGGEGTRAD